MTDETQPPSKSLTSLDIQAKELGIGGNLSPETDESLYCLLYTSDAADE